MISRTADSIAKAACTRAGSPSSSGHSVRRHAPSGGIAAPDTTAQASTAASGAPGRSAANAASATAQASAPGISTAGWPRRSMSRPSAGAQPASASDWIPAATPAAANEPVSSLVRRMNTSPMAAAGVRPIIELRKSRAEP